MTNAVEILAAYKVHIEREEKLVKEKENTILNLNNRCRNNLRN